jgi:hypothetical protein
MITASCIRTTPGSVPSTSYSVRRLNEGLRVTTRLTEHVVAPVRGIGAPLPAELANFAFIGLRGPTSFKGCALGLL